MPRNLVRNDQTKSFHHVQKEDVKDRIDVRIGDDKDPSVFHPQFKMERWDNEANASFRLVDFLPGQAIYTESNGVVEWKKMFRGKEWIARFYEDWGNPEGAYKFVEMVFPERPPVDEINFTIQSKDVNFFYQPALTQEEIDEGASRPDEVVGSYAIYSKSSGGINRAGGKEYKAGKVGHLYRAKLIDALGNETWCDYNTDLKETGLLTIKMNKDWLDSAIYPVILDPTFGYTSIGASTSSIINSRMYHTVGNPGESGSIDSISCYVVTVSIREFYCCLYLESDGSLIDNGALSDPGSGGPSWYTENMLGSASISDQLYRVSVLREGGASSNMTFYYDTGGANSGNFQSATFGTPPDPFTFTESTSLYSIYATYTAGAGTTTSTTTSTTTTSTSTTTTSTSTTTSTTTTSTSSSTSTSTSTTTTSTSTTSSTSTTTTVSITTSTSTTTTSTSTSTTTTSTSSSTSTTTTSTSSSTSTTTTSTSSSTSTTTTSTSTTVTISTSTTTSTTTSSSTSTSSSTTTSTTTTYPFVMYVDDYSAPLITIEKTTN